jgi:phenylalanine-4-hydroxylase
VDQVLNQEFSTSEMQPVLYAVESFDQIYEATYEAERTPLPRRLKLQPRARVV